MESSDDGFSDGGAAIHCALPEFSYECESRVFLPGADGSVEKYVSRRNAPRLDFQITKIPCENELSQAERSSNPPLTTTGVRAQHAVPFAESASARLAIELEGEGLPSPFPRAIGPAG